MTNVIKAIKQATTKPVHVLKAEEFADIILQDYPMHVHSEIISEMKSRIIKTHQINIEQIQKI